MNVNRADAGVVQDEPEIVSFGAFQFDRRGLLLSTKGSRLPIQPKALLVLRCLVDRPGKVVLKDELMDLVWDDAAVTDNSLVEAIRLLRLTLGDDPRSPTYIETVHRRGYRFIAPIDQHRDRPGDVAFSDSGSADVEDDAADSEAGTADVELGIAPLRPRSRPLLWGLTAVAVAAVVVTSVIYFVPDDAPAPLPSLRFSIAAPPGATFASIFDKGASEGNVVITPDGSTLVYQASYPTSGDWQVHTFVSPLNSLTSKRILAFGDHRRSYPFFSPDGTRLGFFDGRILKVVALADGKVTTLCRPSCVLRNPGPPRLEGGTWAPDGTIVFAHAEQLMRISADGGEPQVIPNAAIEFPRNYASPSFLPGWKWVLVTIRRSRTVLGAQIAVVHSATGESRILIENGANARYVPTGHLLFVRDGDIWAVGFDLEELAPTGEPELVLKGVLTSASSGNTHFTVSETGTLAYKPGAVYSRKHEVVFADNQGSVQPLLEDRRNVSEEGIRYSPDGAKLAVVTLVGADHDIWIYDLERSRRGRLARTHISLQSPRHRRV